MQLRQTTYKVIAAAIIALALAAPATAACERLWVVDHELWSAEGDQTRLLVADVHGVFYPRWSPAGDRVAYARDFRFDNGPQSEIVVVSAAGQPLASLAIPADSAVNAIVQVGWRDDRHVYAEGHVNPSTTKYFEWDVATGRLLEEKAGSWFAVSPDGRFIAQRAHVPHGAPPPFDSGSLLINDQIAYPAEGDTAYHRFVGEVSWSPDSSRVALLDKQNDATSLVIVTPGKGATQRIPVATSAGPAGLTWSGQHTVVIRSGNDEWRVDSVSGKTEKSSERAVSTQSAAPPATLRERARGISPRAEDSRCND